MVPTMVGMATVPVVVERRQAVVRGNDGGGGRALLGTSHSVASCFITTNE